MTSFGAVKMIRSQPHSVSTGDVCWNDVDVMGLGENQVKILGRQSEMAKLSRPKEVKVRAEYERADKSCTFKDWRWPEQGGGSGS